MKGQMTLKDFRACFESNRGIVRQISKEEITILYLDDYYDGMLSGMLAYRGENLRFEIITDYTKLIYPRTFAVINLSQEQLQEETNRHELFKRHVADYKNRIYKPVDEHHLYFDRYGERNDFEFELSTVIAWFIE
jgi:hypothetical protein